MQTGEIRKPVCTYTTQILEIGVVRRTGEGDDITNVGHTCHEEQQTLEAEAEARVGAGTILAGVEIPPHILHGDTQLLYASEQLVIVGLTLQDQKDD